MTQTAHFTRNVTIDKVTGKELSATDWQSTDATFEAVTAPEVTGWTAPKEPVASETVTADTANQTETVKYTGQDMRYDFTFYDADDNNKVLYHWDVLASPLDPDISKKQAFIVDDLEAKGFEFEDAGYVEDVSRRSTVYPSAVVNGRTVTTNLSVWYFNHGTQVVTPENPKDGVETSKTVTRTINYVDANGKTIAPSVTQTAHFTRNVTIDKVTGKELSATDWQSTDATFEAVATPTVNGWIAPSSATASETVTANTDNQVETVQYKSTTDIYYEITFYDVDDNNKVLFHKTLLQTDEDPKTVIGDTDFVNDTEGAGVALETAGYVNDYDGQIHETGTKTENGRTVYYEIGKLYFHHGTQIVTPENPKDGVETSKTVTRTINYVDADGKTVAPSVTQTAHFTRNVTIDKVTGKELSATDWKSTDATFEAVTSPSIDGMTADNGAVQSQTVTADSVDSIETVRYTKNADSSSDNGADKSGNNDADKDKDSSSDKDADKSGNNDADKDKNSSSDKDGDKSGNNDADKDKGSTSDKDTDKSGNNDADKDKNSSSDKDGDKSGNNDADKDKGSTSDKDADKSGDNDADKDKDSSSDKDADKSGNNDADKDKGSSSDKDGDKSGNNDADKDKNSSSDNGADKSGSNDADKGKNSSSDKDADKSGDNDADKDKDSTSDKDADKSDNKDADQDKNASSDNGADKSGNNDASSNNSANQSVTSKTTLPATGEESNAATTVTTSDVAQTTVNKNQSTKQVETEVPATAKKAQNHTVEIIALTLSSAAAAFWFTRKK